MKLPPSIEAILDNENNNWMSPRELAIEIAHEACRLQREADLALYNKVPFGYIKTVSEAPLVVPSTEDL